MWRQLKPRLLKLSGDDLPPPLTSRPDTKRVQPNRRRHARAFLYLHYKWRQNAQTWLMLAAVFPLQWRLCRENRTGPNIDPWGTPRCTQRWSAWNLQYHHHQREKLVPWRLDKNFVCTQQRHRKITRHRLGPVILLVYAGVWWLHPDRSGPGSDLKWLVPKKDSCKDFRKQPAGK